MKKYYIAVSDDTQGPYTIEELKKLDVTKDSFIWCEGFEDWKKASEIPELSDLCREAKIITPQSPPTSSFPLIPLILGLVIVFCIGGFFLYTQIINTSNTSGTENNEEVLNTENTEADESSPNNKTIHGKYPQASQRLLNSSDLSGLGTKDLKIMRNEIFARHGYLFETQDMKAYFERQNWYQGLYQNVQSKLTEIEKNNISLIKNQEALLNTSNNPDGLLRSENQYSQIFVSRNYDGNGIIEILECTFSSSDVFKRALYKTSKGKQIELQILFADENYARFQFPNSTQIFILVRNGNKITCTDPENREQYFFNE